MLLNKEQLNEKLAKLTESIKDKKQLSKTDMYELFSTKFNILNLDEAYSKISKAYKQEVFNIIETVLSPKTGSLNIEFPSKDINGVMHHYCRYFEEYYPEDKIVMVNGKSKGYSKPAWAKWTRANEECKTLQNEAMELMADGDFISAQAKATEQKALREIMNTPAYYDKVKDWEDYKPRLTEATPTEATPTETKR